MVLGTPPGKQTNYYYSTFDVFKITIRITANSDKGKIVFCFYTNYIPRIGSFKVYTIGQRGLITPFEIPNTRPTSSSPTTEQKKLSYNISRLWLRKPIDIQRLVYRCIDKPTIPVNTQSSRFRTRIGLKGIFQALQWIWIFLHYDF